MKVKIKKKISELDCATLSLDNKLHIYIEQKTTNFHTVILLCIRKVHVGKHACNIGVIKETTFLFLQCMEKKDMHLMLV